MLRVEASAMCPHYFESETRNREKENEYFTMCFEARWGRRPVPHYGVFPFARAKERTGRCGNERGSLTSKHSKKQRSPLDSRLLTH